MRSRFAPILKCSCSVAISIFGNNIDHIYVIFNCALCMDETAFKGPILKALNQFSVRHRSGLAFKLILLSTNYITSDTGLSEVKEGGSMACERVVLK